ncbi:hypothetical protein [Shinella sumterensis]|uniref:Oligosaccharide repeat unit polymerase n=1 Tax=Shinella sumterensis TaxID=1967501 RepID=A0AA50CKR9_9HYPH|nr:hypothetical protein [Shinella sumterensis]WLR96192.1 hypothetical protein Q9313_10660 [Shinella sumterensis]
MHRSAIALVTFALFPALISFGIVPFFGVLDIEGISPWTYAYLAIFYAPIILATLAFVAIRQRSTAYDMTMGSRLNLYLLAALSAIYLAVSAYDIVSNQNILTLGISGSWKASTDAGARNSIPGAIIMLLSGAPTFLFCAALFNDGSWGSKRLLMLLASLMLGASLACMLLLSSRNSAFICLVYICVVLALKALHQLGRMSLKFPFGRAATTFVAVVICFAVLMGFSLWIFVDRAIVTYGSIDLALDGFFLNYKVHPTVAVPSSETGKKIFYALAQLEFYITHSVGYFSDYFNRDYCPAGSGANSFYGAFRIIDFLFGTDFVQTAVSRMILPGVYLSLPGFLYLDFCQTGMVAGWVMGVATVLTVAGVFRGDPALIFLAAFLLCMFTFAPFYSLPSTGNGFSLMMFAIGSSMSRILSVKMRPEEPPSDSLFLRSGPSSV